MDRRTDEEKRNRQADRLREGRRNKGRDGWGRGRRKEGWMKDWTERLMKRWMEG